MSALPIIGVAVTREMAIAAGLDLGDHGVLFHGNNREAAFRCYFSEGDETLVYCSIACRD